MSWSRFFNGNLKSGLEQRLTNLAHAVELGAFPTVKAAGGLLGKPGFEGQRNRSA